MPVLSCFHHFRLCATPWTVACQAPLSMGFSRQEYWSRLPFPYVYLHWLAGPVPPAPPECTHTHTHTHTHSREVLLPWMVEYWQLRALQSQFSTSCNSGEAALLGSCTFLHVFWAEVSMVFVLDYRGCLYSEDPWKTERRSPSGAQDRFVSWTK